jgi:extradiol dioxygenase family protein
VLDLVRHGMRRSEIAQRRGTTVDAVKYHLTNIADKLGVPTRELRHWPGIPNTTALARRRNETTMADSSTATRIRSIGQVALSIKDVARAEHFYGETLGLAHVFTFGDLAFFDAGGTRLYLHRRPEGEWRPGSILYFTVEDIHAAQERLAADGVSFSGAPHVIYTHEDGTEEWMTFFDDGEGNTLALMSSVTPG